MRKTLLVLGVSLFLIGVVGVNAGHAFSGGAHALVGASLGQSMADETSAFLGGFASHALLDMIPHAEWDLVTQGALFAAAAFMVHQEVERTNDRRLVWGAVGGILPDLEHFLYDVGWIKRKYYPTHNGTLPHGRTDKWAGLWIEAGVTGIMVGLTY